MQLILSHLRRCIEDYDMIQPGDRIAVGVSGGKDSLVLLTAMARLQKFYPVPFELHALTVHPGVPEMDFGPVQTLCDELGVPYHIIQTQIFDIIFNVRKEKNPCSMCAKMRRGALHNAMAELGLNKIALGHHYDDAVETFFLSLFYEGRLSCFQPVTYLDRMGITQIRPLLYCGEGCQAAQPAHRPQPLSGGWKYPPPGGEGAGGGAVQDLPQSEELCVWSHAAPAPAGVGAQRVSPPPLGGGAHKRILTRKRPWCNQAPRHFESVRLFCVSTPASPRKLQR